ncbi:MAG: 4Fe-4S dicluster domain-containing protein [Gammaproteobacteria bacterium]|nr:4Fe-4S dicluster domain-containing protein [Gammaproteobacteria bacterium]MCP5135363.1 4Fe-4S dicluster domain-containing protein [Gammaproteobacteria bacterium]
MHRRTFLRELVTAAALLALPTPSAAVRSQQRYLRPPGAAAEEDFAALCIRCGQCGQVCPNRCIEFFGAGNGAANIDTPYIVPREQACILCMKCGDACPTDALTAIPREAEAIIAGVRMGTARVDESLCLSYQGKTCGVCYRACPLQDVAIRAGRLEQPIVIAENCVGCGLCERSCIQMPQAIRIIPDHRRARRASAIEAST